MLTQMSLFADVNRASQPIALYSSQQVYAIEQDWFAQGYSSFALMQQAAWQMTQYIIKLDYHNRSIASKTKYLATGNHCQHSKQQPRACVWVGHGNNGGDGWLVAHYLQQAGWRVQIITVGIDEVDHHKEPADDTAASVADAIKAQRIALASNCAYQRFEDSFASKRDDGQQTLAAEVYVDAIFGIGLQRTLTGVYAQAIKVFNNSAQETGALVCAVDVPSGLVASTGQVFEHLAVQADVTLCLIARKFGLHTKDGMDYAGKVIDIPLIPYDVTESGINTDINTASKPVATLLTDAQPLCPRQQNSYKGSYGHVLIIGGNRVDGSQGMGGAAILSAASAMATGAGKITVACHQDFHGALLASLPDAMTIDLHDQDGIKNLLTDASVIAIGMGLGRDDTAKELFISYMQAIIRQGKSLIIDADGLYHLASLHRDGHELVVQLHQYSKQHEVCFTPHSGEAARMLEQKVSAIETDRRSAIQQCADIYGGNWVLKGAGSLILSQNKVYVSAVGNAGMASAGMGDVLSGVIAGLLAQKDLNAAQRSLQQAVLIHGLSGDVLVSQQVHGSRNSIEDKSSLLIGQRGLQAQDMPAAIRHVMQILTT